MTLAPLLYLIMEKTHRAVTFSVGFATILFLCGGIFAPGWLKISFQVEDAPSGSIDFGLWSSEVCLPLEDVKLSTCQFYATDEVGLALRSYNQSSWAR